MQNIVNFLVLAALVFLNIFQLAMAKKKEKELDETYYILGYYTERFGTVPKKDIDNFVGIDVKRVQRKYQKTKKK